MADIREDTPTKKNQFLSDFKIFIVVDDDLIRNSISSCHIVVENFIDDVVKVVTIVDDDLIGTGISSCLYVTHWLSNVYY